MSSPSEYVIINGRLREALNKLGQTVAGGRIARAIMDKGTRVEFGKTLGDVAAQFDSGANEVIVSERCQSASLAVLAAYLAHEGTHVQWDEPNPIDQEYHAFKAEAAVWEELKGDESNWRCEMVAWVISRGEREAKKQIRRAYPELPEYWHQ